MREFIVLEGLDFCGKSSIAENLKQLLLQKGIPCMKTREPGGCDFSEKLRPLFLQENMDPITELFLMMASRKEHLVRTIKPALEQGKFVVCERFIMSTYVYQGQGKQIDIDTINKAVSILGCIPPTLYILFDISYETSKERAEKTGLRLDRFEAISKDEFDGLRKAYLSLVDKFNAKVIDASQPYNLVLEQVVEFVNKSYKVKILPDTLNYPIEIGAN